MNALSSTTPAASLSWMLPLSLLSPENACERLPCRHQQAAGPHSSACFELLFLEAGEGWYQTRQRKVWAEPGDIFLATPNEAHDTGGLRDTRSWVVSFEADALASSLTTADPCLSLLNELLLLSFLGSKNVEISHFQVALVDRSRWLAWLQQLKYELHHKSAGYTEAARALLRLLLIEIARLAADQIGRRPPQSQPLLISVFQFIEKHYCNQIGLCDVAKAVNRSPAYLTDFVRRETGRTVLSWIIERRLAEARRLLLMTDRSVEKVAEAVGYFDTGYFIRQFRRSHTMTPRAWRNEHRQLDLQSIAQRSPTKSRSRRFTVDRAVGHDRPLQGCLG